MKRLPPPVLAISPGDLARARDAGALLARVERAVSGGLRGMLLREPELGDGELLELARALRERLDRGGAGGSWLGVHDRYHVAAAAGAAAVHAGFRSLPAGELARLADGRLAVGLSTHATDDPADWTPADYLFHGPVLATPSKAGRLEPIGFEGLARAVAASPRPVWGLGGLRAEHLGEVRRAGASGAALLSGILSSPDPAAAASACLDAWGAP